MYEKILKNFETITLFAVIIFLSGIMVVLMTVSVDIIIKIIQLIFERGYGFQFILGNILSLVYILYLGYYKKGD
tara:strand:+ start:443 stop:664 length:222 start_codon:yes stop_codon:yes gene_type:complete